MLVLRFTVGQTTQEVQTPRAEVVVGTDPAADVTLAQSPLPPRAFRLVREGTTVRLEMLDGGRAAVTLRVGDEVAVLGVRVSLAGLLPDDVAAMPRFGGYDDEPSAPATRTFELTEPRPGPVLAGAQPLPRADTASPPTERRSTRKRERRMAAAATTAASADVAAGAPPSEAEASPPKRELTPEEKAALLAPLRFGPPDFGTELVRQLKRTPFFALSVGFHVLIFLILALFDTTNDAASRRPVPSLTASVSAQDEDPGHPEEDMAFEALPEPEDQLPELEDLVLDEPPPPPEDEAPPPSPFREEEEAEHLSEPPDIGVMPGLRAATRQVKPRKKKPTVDPRQMFNKGSAQSSNQRSAEVLRAAMAGGRGGGASLEQLDENDILVVAGSFDHIERVLDALRLPYAKVAPWALVGPRPPDFSQHKVIFWNCGESLGKHRMVQIGRQLESFVRNGGYLFTTDWGVDNVLRYALPGYLTSNGNRAHLPEMVLDIEPARSARDHPLLDGVFHKGVKGKWWLEQASFDMAVARPDAVTVLIECPALHDQFNRSSAVAATFHHGRGRVLHAMGHYYQEAGNLAGTMSVHRLALNFVLMRLEQDKP